MAESILDEDADQPFEPSDSDAASTSYDDEDEDEDSDNPCSPDTLAQSDARRSARDERILRLDLSRHQALLVDSQRLNQSLKRCLGWTEELIVEGRKALEYRVRVSEVELGGRVLSPDEVAEDVDGEGEVKEAEAEAEAVALPTELEQGELQDQTVHSMEDDEV